MPSSSIWINAWSTDILVPHAKIKAVELGHEVRRTVVLNRSKYNRLLTLPRQQRGSLPTHLLRSTNGDYLRARLIEMDDTSTMFSTPSNKATEDYVSGRFG